MSYIRTKNRIYKVESETCHKQGYYIDRYEEDVILKKQVIKKSENLEELCDEFILEEKMREVIYHHKSTKFDDFKTIAILNERYTLYGAVWCEWGLKYVAKLDDKGDFELI